MKTVMRNKKIIKTLLYFSILYNVMFFFSFFRGSNFFFPPLIFVFGRKLVIYKLLTADFSIIHSTIIEAAESRTGRALENAFKYCRSGNLTR